MPGDDECTATTFAPVTKEGPLRPPADDFWHRLDTEPDYARPLAVQIAALLHVADSEVAADRPGIAYLLDRILGLNMRTGARRYQFTISRTGRPRSTTASPR